MWLMAFGSAIHKRSSCTRVPIDSVMGSNKVHRRTSNERMAIPQKRRSNERYSRTPRGISSPVPQFLLREDTTGALDGFHVQYRQPPGRGKRGTDLHTENPRRVHRSRDIPDRRKFLVPSKKGICDDCRTSHECSELVFHGWFVV